MTRYEADLHIHTLVSPCAEIEMIPSLVVEAATRAGLDLIAITDHNSCENAGAVIEVAEQSALKVLPGMELQSVEGVHLLCIFDELDSALGLQEIVYEKLIRVSGAEETYNQQMIVDANDDFVSYCEHPLSLPTTMDIDEVWWEVSGLGGIVIPSHIDRIESGLCGVLGMVPETPEFLGVEISRNIQPEHARAVYPSIGDRPIFRNSDAHWLAAIGERRTVLYMEHRSIEEIRLACAEVGGRRVKNA